MKSKNLVSAFTAGGILALAVLACSLGSPPSPDQPLEGSPEVLVESPPGGPCANPYLPVVTGATWSYSGGGSSSGQYSFTDTIAQVREDGFTLTGQFEGLNRSQEWSCSPAGLTALSLGGGSAAGIQTEAFDLDLETSNVEGVTLPAEITPGDQWSSSLDFSGMAVVDELSVEARGSATTNYTAVGEESVTVPAGTFNALKIHSETVLSIQADFGGLSVPVTVTNSSDTWFAPGVGWVKSVSTGEIMGEQVDDNIELQAYSIP